MVKKLLVSLSDRSNEHKNDGIMALPVFQKPFPGRPWLSALIEGHVFQQLATSACADRDRFQAANPLQDVIEHRSRHRHFRNSLDGTL
jgi:hypothetical protein